MRSATAQTGDALRTAQSSVEFKTVPADQLRFVWDTLGPWVRRALRHGQGTQTSEPDIIARVMKETSYLWVGTIGEEIVAGIFWSVRRIATGHKIWIDLAVGKEMDLWFEQAQEHFRRLADDIGAKCVEGSCRPGMARRLMRKGCKQKAIIVEMSCQ